MITLPESDVKEEILDCKSIAHSQILAIYHIIQNIIKTNIRSLLWVNIFFGNLSKIIDHADNQVYTFFRIPITCYNESNKHCLFTYIPGVICFFFLLNK